MNFTDAQILSAKRKTVYSQKASAPAHKHNNCIRIAAEWLDAQKRTLRPQKTNGPIKHMIQAWAGTYISQSDVEVAAVLLGLLGTYDDGFNISKRLVEPNKARIATLVTGLAPNAPSDSAQYSYSSKE